MVQGDVRAAFDATTSAFPDNLDRLEQVRIATPDEKERSVKGQSPSRAL
jgi:hypothetical protein